jgi:hypothetical protein
MLKTAPQAPQNKSEAGQNRSYAARGSGMCPGKTAPQAPQNKSEARKPRSYAARGLGMCPSKEGATGASKIKRSLSGFALFFF